MRPPPTGARPGSGETAPPSAAGDGAVLLGFAVLLVALATGWSGLAAGEPAAGCPHPREHASIGGWTVDVHCGGEWLGPPLRGPARLLFGRTLDVNHADPRALESLPRIGPSRAASIEAARRMLPFSSLDDLQRVSGIGPRTVEGLEGWAHASVASVPDSLPRARLVEGEERTNRGIFTRAR